MGGRRDRGSSNLISLLSPIHGFTVRLPPSSHVQFVRTCISDEITLLSLPSSLSFHLIHAFCFSLSHELAFFLPIYHVFQGLSPIRKLTLTETRLPLKRSASETMFILNWHKKKVSLFHHSAFKQKMKNIHFVEVRNKWFRFSVIQMSANVCQRHHTDTILTNHSQSIKSL